MKSLYVAVIGSLLPLFRDVHHALYHWEQVCERLS